MRPPRTVSVVAALAAAALLGGGIAASQAVGVPQGGAAASRPHDAVAASGQQIVGYAESGGTTSAQLRASGAVLTTVGVDGVDVTPDGGGVTPVSADALALLAAAHADKKKAELLVGNFDGDLGDFSPAIGDALLGSPSQIESVVRALAADVRSHGWDGVTVDLESLTDSHPDGLTSFVSQLSSALGPDRSVSVCLMATPDHYAAEGYDLKALGRAADHVVLMAYDQHGPTWSKAGPVGGRPWVEDSLAPLLRVMPAAKVQLGVAGYGYTWPSAGSGDQLSDADARAAVKADGARATWSTAQQEWHATLSNGTVIWWSDARTLALRREYAEKLHLGGVAVWSLGLSDPLT